MEVAAVATAAAVAMGVGNEDAVLIRVAEKAGEPSKITVNCPDKTGLGCDFCWIILDFGLRITKGGENGPFSSLPLVSHRHLLFTGCWSLGFSEQPLFHSTPQRPAAVGRFLSFVDILPRIFQPMSE